MDAQFAEHKTESNWGWARQMRAMREYAAKRGWAITVQIKEIGFGAAECDRIPAAMAEARLQGKHLRRPVTLGKKGSHIRKLHRAGVSKAEVAWHLNIGRI